MAADVVPFFSGEPAGAGTTAVTPSTFMKRFRAHMRDLGGQNDAQKIEAFEDYLAEGSPAERWFRALQGGATPVTTWAALEAAFHVRFPGPVKAERTTQEWERELVGMKLTLEELDTIVDVGGTEVYAHVNFASKLLERAQLAQIETTASGIWQSRDKLPEVLKDKVSATQTDWTTYTNAIKAVDRVHIKEGAVKARKAQEMERTVADLSRARTAPLTPVSRMAVQMSRTALATPAKAAMAPTPARAGATTNPFEAGGGRGNLFTPPDVTVEAREYVRKMVARLAGAMLDDNIAGRQEYSRRIAKWIDVHGKPGSPRVLLEKTGFPLSPGTVPPNSGECFGCGKVTVPFHTRRDCSGPTLPTRESTFRAICAKYLKEDRAVAINEVEEVDDLDWIDFAPELAAQEDFAEGLSL